MPFGGALLVSGETDANGQFSFEQVAPGTYTIQVEASVGYASSASFTVGSGNLNLPAIQIGSLQLTGTVEDPNGQPLAGAGVLVVPQALPFAVLAIPTTTASDGSFSFTGLTAGTYQVEVVQSGFATQIQTVTVSGATTSLTVQLQVGTTLSGTITDLGTGAAISGAEITVASATNQDVAGTASSDANGAYTVTNLVPGTYNVFVFEANHTLAEVFGIVVGTNPLTQNVQMQAPTTTLQGTVTDALGNPIANANVNITDGSGNLLLSAQTNFAGQFVIDQLPPGTWTVTVTAEGYFSAVQTNVVLHNNQTTSGVNFTLSAAGVDDSSLTTTLEQFRTSLDVLSGVVLSKLFFDGLDPAHEPKPPTFDPNSPIPDILPLLQQILNDGFACQAETDALNKLLDAETAMDNQFLQYQNDYANLVQTAGAGWNTVINDLRNLLQSLNPSLQLANAVSGTTVDGLQDLAIFVSNVKSNLDTLTSLTVSMASSLRTNPPQSFSDFLNFFGQFFNPASTDTAGNFLSVLGTILGIPGVPQPAQLLAKFNKIKAIADKAPGIGTIISLISTALDFANAMAAFNDAITKVQEDQALYNADVKAYLAAYAALQKAIADCEKSHGQKPNPLPPPPKPTIVDGHLVFPKGSGDPNDLSGPTGFGPQQFVPLGLALPYTISFANEPTATAPAQVVIITEQLSPDLDFSTFQVGNIGIGSTVIQVPAGRRTFQTQVDLTATLGVYVDVSVDINLETGLVTWTFTTIDPTTLDVPTGKVNEGFLPPDTTPPIGEGFVSYTVQPKATDPSGTVITAQATVVFDSNAPIATNSVFNTIDASPPSSTVNPLPATTTATSFLVSWTGTEPANTPGIASYDIYVSDDGGPFRLLLQTTQTSAIFQGVLGHTYGFFSVAIDNVGLAQPIPQSAQVFVTIVAPNIPFAPLTAPVLSTPLSAPPPITPVAPVTSLYTFALANLSYLQASGASDDLPIGELISGLTLLVDSLRPVSPFQFPEGPGGMDGELPDDNAAPPMPPAPAAPAAPMAELESSLTTLGADLLATVRSVFDDGAALAAPLGQMPGLNQLAPLPVESPVREVFAGPFDVVQNAWTAVAAAARDAAGPAAPALVFSSTVEAPVPEAVAPERAAPASLWLPEEELSGPWLEEAPGMPALRSGPLQDTEEVLWLALAAAAMQGVRLEERTDSALVRFWATVKGRCWPR